MASRKQSDRDPRSAPTALWLLAGSLFVVLAIISLEALYYYRTNAEQAEKASRAAVEADSLKEAQLGRMQDYGWLVDPEASEEAGKQVLTFQLPIERAMQVVVKKASNNPN